MSIAGLISLLPSCSPYVNARLFHPTLMKEYQEQRTFLFHDCTYAPVEIKLKLQEICYDYSSEPADVKMSYTITVNSPLSSSASIVYLRLMDSSGFELDSFCTGSVVKEFTGSIKGTITIPVQAYQKIGGAEIELRHRAK